MFADEVVVGNQSTQDEAAETVEVVDGKIVVTTKHFKPPADYRFKKQDNNHYAKASGHNLVEGNIDLSGAKTDDQDVQVKYKNLPLDPLTADQWALTAWGQVEAKPAGKGGGKAKEKLPEKPWEVKTKVTPVVLVLDNVNLNGGATLSGNTEVTVSDPAGPLPWARNALNAWAPDVEQRVRPFAYIRNTPAMPKIQAKVLGAPAGSQIEWSVQISYDRTVPTTNGHRLQTSIPNAAANVNGIRDGGAAPGRVWNIAAVLPAPAFYGGEGVLVWTLKKRNHSRPQERRRRLALA